MNSKFMLVLFGFSLFSGCTDKAEFNQLGEPEDLNKIRGVAESFIEEYNFSNKTSWVTSSINLKVVVSRCEGKMSAKWDRVIFGNGELSPYWHIKVSCDETNDLMKSWVVIVPTDRRK